ncbi:MAG: TonB-dependent receptor [Alphaproteobacteria bacterium]|jgi:vitamin B12 transporter|nr:TonB-dependent receptor [Alphaproteobacteria bacterium]
MKFFYLSCILIIATYTQSILAEEVDNSAIRADESIAEYQQRINQKSIKPIENNQTINVIAPRIRESYNGSFIITREMIANSGSLSVADLLSKQPSIFIQSSGDFGQSATVSLNGSLPQHVVILLDGVRLGDPSNAQPFFDIGQIPLSFIDEIEIIKGPSAVLHGSGAIAGVINIKTIKYEENIATIKQEVGTNNTLTTQAGINVNIENFNFTIFGNFFRTEGYSIAAQPNAGEELENDKSKVQDINLKLSYSFSEDTYIDSFFKIGSSSADYDGFDTLPYDVAGNYVDKKENLYYFSYNFKLFDNFRNQLRFSQYMADKRYVEILNSKSNEYEFSSKEQIFSYKGDYMNEFFSFTGGFDFQAKRMNNSPQSTNDFAFYGNLREYLSKRMSLEQGIRFNQNQKNLSIQDTTFTNNYAYNLGMSYDVMDDAFIKLNYGAGYRLPSLYELFSDYGNYNLTPESSQGLNFEFSSNNFTSVVQQFRFNAFYNEISDMIFFTNSTYENIGDYTTMGFDITFPFSIGNFLYLNDLKVFPTYTYTNTKDSNNNSTTVIPNHKFSTTLDMGIIKQYHLSWTSLWASSTSSTFDGINYSLPSYWVNNLMVSRNLSGSSKLYVRVDNVFNQQYQTSYGYNTKDRSYYFGLVVEM